MPGAALSGIRLTLAFTPSSRRTSRRASAGVSLTPSSSTYSKVMRLRFLTGKRLQASIIGVQAVLLARRHERRALLLGGRVQRDRQVGHQRLGRQPVDHRHEADGGQRDATGRHRQPVRVVEQRQRLHGRVVVVERLAHAHEHDVERRVEQPGGVRQHPHLAGNLAGASGAARGPSCPSGRRRSPWRSRPASTRRRSGPACRECRRTRSAGGRPAPAPASACRRRNARDARSSAWRCGTGGRVARAASRPRSLIAVEVGGAALPDPLEDLARPEPRQSLRLDQAPRARATSGRRDRSGVALHEVSRAPSTTCAGHSV